MKRSQMPQLRSPLPERISPQKNSTRRTRDTVCRQNVTLCRQNVTECHQNVAICRNPTGAAWGQRRRPQTGQKKSPLLKISPARITAKKFQFLRRHILVRPPRSILPNLFRQDTASFSSTLYRPTTHALCPTHAPMPTHTQENVSP